MSEKTQISTKKLPQSFAIMTQIRNLFSNPQNPAISSQSSQIQRKNDNNKIIRRAPQSHFGLRRSVIKIPYNSAVTLDLRSNLYGVRSNHSSNASCASSDDTTISEI